MKKNKMMRLASGLLVAVLITTSTISGTFAKYTTDATATDTARVAQWGIVITAEADAATNTLFGKNYTDVVSTSDDVVAPGTSGTLSTFTVAGTPEVNFKTTYTANLELSADWVAGGGVYFPIEFTVNGTTLTIGENENLETFAGRVEGEITSMGKTYDANDSVDDTLAVSWSWPFSTSAANDVKDTELAAAQPTISLTVTCLAEQIGA